MAGQSNSLILGSINGVNSAVVDTKVGIGTTTPTAILDVNGNFKLGNNGTITSEIINATVNQLVAAIGANSSGVETFLVPNAQPGSSVNISPDIPLPDGLIIAYARVSALNRVEVKFANVTGTIITPVASNYYISVIR